MKIQQIESANKSISRLLNEAIHLSISDFIMYIDNRNVRLALILIIWDFQSLVVNLNSKGALAIAMVTAHGIL